LTVTIRDANDITIHKREVHDAFANETLGTPTPNATYAKDDDTFVLNAFHRFAAQQKFGTIK
jgi:hypothetical protein